MGDYQTTPEEIQALESDERAGLSPLLEGYITFFGMELQVVGARKEVFNPSPEIVAKRYTAKLNALYEQRRRLELAEIGGEIFPIQVKVSVTDDNGDRDDIYQYKDVVNHDGWELVKKGLLMMLGDTIKHTEAMATSH